MPRILLLDIETSPAIAYVWRLFDENIGIDQLIQPSRVICWGAKWIGESRFLYADERSGQKKMFEGIHSLLSACDAVITYNGNSFDIPKLNGAFVEHGLPPLPPLTSIDLYQTVKQFGFQSNKLAYVAPFLKIGQKVKNEGFPLWAACMKGDKEAWKRMKHYNEGDVRLLQGLYKAVRPHMKNHPRLYESGCPDCGETATTGETKYRKTTAYRFPYLQCASCHGWYKGKRQSLRSAA